MHSLSLPFYWSTISSRVVRRNYAHFTQDFTPFSGLSSRATSTLSTKIYVIECGECIECENSTDSENCECDTTSCVSFFYCCYNIPLHHNFTCIRGFRVCLIQLLVFSHQCIHIKVSEQIQTNTCHQDLLAYLSVRRQPTYTI